MSDLVPEIPPRVPRGGNAALRWLGRCILRIMGWRVTGGLPDVPRFLAIAAPHTSNWDWVLAMATAFAIGVRINYMIKDTAFFWPLGVLLRWTGGLPIDRDAPAGSVDSALGMIASSEEIILIITPEGTRRRVDRWKTGFLRIAEQCRLPVVQISWDYPRREIRFGPLAELSGDHEADILQIREYYRQFTGRNPENQSP